jgi:hypothetical protein
MYIRFKTMYWKRRIPKMKKIKSEITLPRESKERKQSRIYRSSTYQEINMCCKSSLTDSGAPRIEYVSNAIFVADAGPRAALAVSKME